MRVQVRRAGCVLASDVIQNAQELAGQPFARLWSGESGYNCVKTLICAFQKAGWRKTENLLALLDHEKDFRRLQYIFGEDFPLVQGAWQPGDVLLFTSPPSATGDAREPSMHLVCTIANGQLHTVGTGSRGVVRVQHLFTSHAERDELSPTQVLTVHRLCGIVQDLS